MLIKNLSGAKVLLLMISDECHIGGTSEKNKKFIKEENIAKII